MRDIITSRENQAVLSYIRLRDKSAARKEMSAFVTEGHKLTGEALSAGCTPSALYVTEDCLDAYAAYDATPIGDSVAAKLAAGKSCQGVFGVFAMPKLPEILRKRDGRYLLLCRLQDPGNVGTILRSAGAFGLDGVFLWDCADLWSLKTLRATMGGLFHVPFEVVSDISHCIKGLQAAGVHVLGAALEEDATVLTPGLLSDGGFGVLIGNEGSGLPTEVLSVCDGTVLLPMQGGTESLNAASAATVFAWELQKRA